MAYPQICVYHKYGYCKFQNSCRNTHEQELCDIENCDGKICDKRHPKPCRYFQNYGRCKFNPCSYSHGDNLEYVKINKLESIVQDMKQEMHEIRQILNLNDAAMRNMEKELRQHANKVKQPVAEGACKAYSTSSQCQKASHCLTTISTTTRPPIVNIHETSAPSLIRASSLVPFWTTRGSSCCYHECRPDDKPPGKCCYHRCRELWD